MEIDGNIVFDGMDKSYRQILLSKVMRPHVATALMKINKTNFFPGQDEIFSFAQDPAQNVRVIILGREPHADGPYSPNICDEIGQTNLISWTRQGVMFLNLALTAKPNKVGAHLAVWEETTNAIIKYFCAQKRPIVFLLVDGVEQNIHKWVASDTVKFLRYEKKCFSETNEFLVANGAQPIDWKPDRKIILDIGTNVVCGRTKYDTRATYSVSATTCDGCLLFELAGKVLVEADYRNNVIRFVDERTAKKYAESVAYEHIKKNMIGYLTISIVP
jgi:uracil-DNA glycosylase